MVKWDIVDNIMASASQHLLESATPRASKKRFRKVLTTTLFAGTLLLPALTVTQPQEIVQSDVRVSDIENKAVMGIAWEFKRPQSDRAFESSKGTDTTVGMSTRRLSEAFSKLFVPSEEEDTELTGNYSFL